MKGLYSALLVSFDKDGNLNEKGTREIIRHNIDKMQIDGIYVGGSTGECFMMPASMRKRIFEIAKDEAGGKVKLIAQVGSVDQSEAVDLAVFAAKLGFDSLSAVTPFYYKFDFSEILAYYKAIQDASNSKMIIYSIPFLTGVNMNLSQFGELFDIKNVIGVKFTAGDFYLLERVRKAHPDKLIYAGFDEMLLPAVSLGIDGAIGSTYNVTGKLARKIYESAGKGDLKQALKEQGHLNDVIEAILSNGLYQTLKEMLKVEGVDAGYCRAPMKKIGDVQIARAKEIAKML